MAIGKRDTVSDAHCHPKALLIPAAKHPKGISFWLPEWVDPDTVTSQPGLAFRPEALDGPPVWREQRVG